MQILERDARQHPVLQSSSGTGQSMTVRYAVIWIWRKIVDTEKPHLGSSTAASSTIS